MAINKEVTELADKIQAKITKDENGNAAATVYFETLPETITADQATAVHNHDANYIPACRLAAGRFAVQSLNAGNATDTSVTTFDYGKTGTVTVDFTGAEEIRKPGTSAESGEKITSYGRGATIVRTEIDPKGKTGTMGAVNKELAAIARAAITGEKAE